MASFDCVMDAGKMYCKACRRRHHEEQRGVYQGMYVRGPCIGGSPPHDVVQNAREERHDTAHHDDACLCVDLVADLLDGCGDGFPLEVFLVVYRNVEVLAGVLWLGCPVFWA